VHYFPALSCDQVWRNMWCDLTWHIFHAINRTENKGKEIEKKIYVNLAMIASQWSELVVHNNLIKLQTIWEGLIAIGTNPKDKNFVAIVLESLPASYETYLSVLTGCHKLPLWLSPFLLFFSLLFYFLFIAWESLSHYVIQGVTMSHQRVMSQVTRSHGSVGK